MLNKVMLIGRLGRDPEIRYTQSGVPIANFTVATDESYTDKDGNRQKITEWHKIVVFQRQAENCQNYLTKGSLVYIEGSLQTRKWQDQNGQDRYITEVKAQRVQFLDRKGDRPYGSEEEYGGESAPRPPRQQTNSWESQASPRQPRQSGDWDGPQAQRQPRQGGDWDSSAPRQSGQDGDWDGQQTQNRPPANDYQQQRSAPPHKPAQQQQPEEEMGPAFPSEAANMGKGPAMDEVPF